MAWQLGGSILLMIILAFCLLYQMRTILFQKRIDNLRHEFMKNMIYEMKQPPADDNIVEEAIRIGSTDFYYALNELHNSKERAIITSRQAEILKLLVENTNDVVPRETILKQVWGDDSYSNSLALNVQITYLRRALKSDERISIEAVMKKGYVLKVAVYGAHEAR
jgi:DNA-binding winged helix-turn-helix (wHTH) protein